MTSLARRRRALMGKQGGAAKNGLVPGTYTGGSSEWVVDADGVVSVVSWSRTAPNGVTIPFASAVPANVGDSIRVVVQKTNGTMSASPYSYVNVGPAILTNQTWSNGATAVDKTITYDGETPIGHFYADYRVGAPTFNNYQFKVFVYVNGNQVIPGV